MIEYEIFYLGHNMTLISSEKYILSNLEFIKFAESFFSHCDLFAHQKFLEAISGVTLDYFI